MGFYDTVFARRSCRAYKSEKIDNDIIERILSATRFAPSWKNLQCWHLMAVSDSEIKIKLGKVMKNNPHASAYENAPYMFVLCADPSKSGDINGKPYYMTDCGIALEHFCLAAANEGLGTCWVGLFDEDAVKKLLCIPENFRVVALTPLGYPDVNCYRERPRREKNEFLHINKW